MEIIQQLLAVLAVLGLLCGALWVLRQKGLAQLRLTARAGSHRRLELVERLSVTAHHTVCLVRVDDKTVALGLSPSGCQVLLSKDAQ